MKGAANNVLEITRALVDRKEPDTSFEEMMGLLRHSVKGTTMATAGTQMQELSLVKCHSGNGNTEHL